MIPLKDKKGIAFTNAFQKILKESNKKPNTIWVDFLYQKISINVNIDKLDYIDNKYNNTFYRAIEMKPVDVKSSTYIDSSKEINNKDPKFKIGDIVSISKCKSIFAKDYAPDWFEEIFVIKKMFHV